ncbi:MAG TPA: plasmid recombination protein, partial [Candidatus Jeotgalibaca merdavium]|nr:plasmid recombination protein [Candidatus Jeotgalibaca merdavium]
MSYSILRVARVKGSSNSKGIQKHNQRENKNYNNKDINHENTYKNYDLINENKIDYSEKIEDTIHANYSGKRAIRKDAIKHVDGLITSDNEFFNKLNEEETNQFFRDSLDFLEQEYGKENMLYATVHLDEKVPHMHFGFVPLTDDGRLSAKEKLGNKKAMTELQDRFNQYVNAKGYELQRGTAKEVSERQHQDIDKFKKETEYHKQELATVQKDLTKLEKQLDAHISDLRAYSDFEYENEVEVKKGFLTGREELETGRKVVSAEEFERIQRTVTSARNILDDYESITNTNLYDQNQDLRERNLEMMKGHTMLKSKNEKLEKENKEYKDHFDVYKDLTEGIYRYLRNNFRGFDKAYDNLTNKLKENETTQNLGKFMEIVKKNVYLQDLKQEKQKGMDIER